VIICPGGGYTRLSTQREGEQYAYWLSTMGVTSFVLKYRMAEFGHPAPLQDVLRAVRLVRAQAAQYHVQPDRIGVMGSSAGGHLAASAGTLFDNPLGRTGADIDKVSARPDFLMLMYPVIAMEGPAVHAGSRKALLGSAPSAEAVQLMSVEKQVTSANPADPHPGRPGGAGREQHPVLPGAHPRPCASRDVPVRAWRSWDGDESGTGDGVQLAKACGGVAAGSGLAGPSEVRRGF
jgi:hypothetical protein